MNDVTAGTFPFTHGIYPDMYRNRLWTMRQYAGFGTAKESNARYRYLLDHGVSGLSVAFDLPTQLGLDADDARAEGEVGKAGVSISSLADMERLFDKIPLAQITTSMTINATAAILLAMYIVVGEKQGISPSLLGGTVQNDPLKEFAARGNFIFPVRESMRLTTDIIAYGTEFLPKWNPISISGYHMREAGCTAVQEAAFTIANGLAYVGAALESGLDINRIGARLSFFFNAHNNFFEEVAKFRAVRQLWAELMRERFGAADRACQLRFHTQTGGSTLTAQQIENNVVRVAYQALAAVLGGTQSLHTNGKDEALALPTEEAARTALRTQQIIANETGVTEHVDPLAGSYVVEALTADMLTRCREYVTRIDDLGGAVAAIEHGFMQQEIQEAAYSYQQSVESGEQRVVGQNAYVVREEIQPPILKVDASIEKDQRKTLKALRKKRSQMDVDNALEAVTQAAQGTTTVMPSILEAVRVYATLGEISAALQSVFGTYREQARV